MKGCLLPVVVEMGLNNSGIAAGVLNSTDSQESIRILLWESKESCKANSKTTNAILVRPGNTVDSIGIEAELKHYNSKKDKGWFFSKSFMMTLCEREVNFKYFSIHLVSISVTKTKIQNYYDHFITVFSNAKDSCL